MLYVVPSVVVSSNRVRCAALSVLGALFLALLPLNALATGNISLAWDPSSTTNLAGYNIYYGVASLAYTNMVSAGTATSITISNLVEGTTYYFAATAYDTAGLESDYSAEVSGLVSANVPNQVPTLDALVNVTINENAGLQTVTLSGISSGAITEVQTLAVTATSSNPGIVPNPTVTYTSPNTAGSLTFTPVTSAVGSAIITVSVNDGGASNNIVSRSFTITVNPVNQPPTLNALANVTINENAGLQTVNLSGISSGAINEAQTLAVTTTSSSLGIIPNPTVTYTSPNAAGSLTFTPVASASGSAIITVSVNDGGASNNIVSRSFTVTVNPVNQPPTLNALANITINANAGPQTVNLSGISSGAINEAQTLAVTATSSSPGIVPNPTVTYTSPNAVGSIRFTPVTSASGSATLTVTVNDGGASNNIVSRSFTVTVNQPPTISAITNQIIAVDTATQPIPFRIGDAETPVSNLTLFASSDNAALVKTANIVFGGSNSNRTVTVNPLTGQVGLVNITLTVSDGTATANSVFQLSVRLKPAPPGNLRVAGLP